MLQSQAKNFGLKATRLHYWVCQALKVSIWTTKNVYLFLQKIHSQSTEEKKKVNTEYMLNINK